MKRFTIFAVLAAALVLGRPVSSAVAQEGPSLVILVRHGEKAAVPGSDPPLSEAGRARATALAEALANSRVSSIIVSTYRRTMETASVVAKEHGITPEEIGLDGGIAAHVTRAVEAVRKKSGVVLVVGHNNTVPMIAAALGAPRLSDICEDHYAYMFLVQPGTSGDASLTVASYGSPNDPSIPGCVPPKVRPGR